MPTETLLLIGAGGHARVVCDTLEQIDGTMNIDIRDDNPAMHGALLLGRTVTAPVGEAARDAGSVHVAIGNNSHRLAWCSKLQQQGRSLHSIVHPRATVSPRARVGEGCFVAANAVVAVNAVVGPGCIVNHGAVVDHDCAIGACAHIAPNATLGGGVRVGEGVLIGAGAVVLPNLTIGEWAVVGAGAVVLHDVAPRTTVVGVPATSVPSA